MLRGVNTARYQKSILNETIKMNSLLLLMTTLRKPFAQNILVLFVPRGSALVPHLVKKYCFTQHVIAT